MKEIQSENIRCNERPEMTEKPLLDNRDMCGFLSIIIGALVTDMLHEKGLIIFESRLELILVIVSIIYMISVIVFTTTQKVTKACWKHAKRKATSIKRSDF